MRSNMISQNYMASSFRTHQRAQDLSYDYDLFFLYFVNLAISEQLSQNNTQLLHFAINIVASKLGTNIELIRVLAIMLVVYPLLCYFIRD